MKFVLLFLIIAFTSALPIQEVPNASPVHEVPTNNTIVTNITIDTNKTSIIHNSTNTRTLLTVIDVTLPPEITAVAVAVTPDGGA